VNGGGGKRKEHGLVEVPRDHFVSGDGEQLERERRESFGDEGEERDGEGKNERKRRKFSFYTNAQIKS